MSVESWGLASRAQERQDLYIQEAATPGAYILDTVLSLIFSQPSVVTSCKVDGNVHRGKTLKNFSGCRQM